MAGLGGPSHVCISTRAPVDPAGRDNTPATSKSVVRIRRFSRQVGEAESLESEASQRLHE